MIEMCQVEVSIINQYTFAFEAQEASKISIERTIVSPQILAVLREEPADRVLSQYFLNRQVEFPRTEGGSVYETPGLNTFEGSMIFEFPAAGAGGIKNDSL
jgi:hypothetical protein